MSPGIWDEDEREKPSKPGEVPVFFTVTPEIRKRIDAAAGTKKGDLKKWLTGVVTAELDLQDLLEPERARLKAYGAARGLSMRHDRAKIVAGLISAGLDSQEKKPHKK